MANTEKWETAAKLAEARERFEARIPGWQRPFAHGTVMVPAGDRAHDVVTFPLVSVGGAHALPAVVMGLVVGRSDETATFEVTADQLDQAIELLAPAEASTMFKPPHIAAWRTLRDDLRAGGPGRILTVFVADLADPSSGVHDDAFRTQIASGERAPLLR